MTLGVIISGHIKGRMHDLLAELIESTLEGFWSFIHPLVVLPVWGVEFKVGSGRGYRERGNSCLICIFTTFSWQPSFSIKIRVFLITGIVPVVVRRFISAVWLERGPMFGKGLLHGISYWFLYFYFKRANLTHSTWKGQKVMDFCKLNA